MTDEELDEFIKKAENLGCSEDWWNHDFFEEAEKLGKELKELRRQKPRPLPTNNTPRTCNCGCGYQYLPGECMR